MKRILYIISATAIFAVCSGNVGCSGGNAPLTNVAVEEDAVVSGDYAVMQNEAENGDSEATGEVVKDTQKIIKTGRMGLDVNDIASAKAGIDALVSGSGGYYSSENFHETDRESLYSLSIRIPSAGYEKFISSLESSGHGVVTYKEIEAKDVTEEFLDIETRLANKRSYLERYRELLKRAASIDDIMEIGEQVRELEEEIESAEGRLRYLGDRVSYSTLDLSLSREKDYKFIPAKGQKFWEKTKRAFVGGWDILKTLVLGLITIWPLWLIAVAVLLIVRYYKSKKRGNNSQQRT